MRAAGHRLPLGALLIPVCLVVLACQASGNAWTVDGWIFPTAQPLASGASAVALDVQPIPASVPSQIGEWACPAALAQATITYARGASPPIRYVAEAPTGPIEMRWRWPWGFSARDVGGRLEIVAPDGQVYARDGDRVSVGGGWLPDDTEFQICLGQYTPHRG